MNERERAEEHLKIIRQLMERATIYRAISAPTALTAGGASIIAALLLAYALNRRDTLAPSVFESAWAGVLIVALNANTWFVRQGAKQRGEPLLSPGMRLTAQALFPNILAASAVSAAIGLNGRNAFYISLAWTIFYGLGLLSTAQFAPRSIVRLGWAFLLCGTAVLICHATFRNWELGLLSARSQQVYATWTMGIAFGLFHVIYAACTWPRATRTSKTSAQL